MTKKSRDLLVSILEISLNGLIANRLYLHHQLSLPKEHRVMEDASDDEMEDMLRTFRMEGEKLEEALIEFKLDYREEK